MAPSTAVLLTAGKSWGGEDDLVLYNLRDCDSSLRLLRDQAVSYENAQARPPFSTNGDERDDIKRAAFLLMNPLLSGLGVEILAIEEPHDVAEENYDSDDSEEAARFEREARVGDQRAFGGTEDRLEVWCDDAPSVLSAFLSNPWLLDLQPFHPISAADPNLAPAVAIEG